MGRVYLTQGSTSQSITEGIHGRISKQEPGTEMKLRPWRNDVYWLAASALPTLPHSHTAQALLPMDGTASNGLNPSIPINKQENAPQTFVGGQHD